MKKFAKFLSILCTLALIASCISVGFVASAAEATFTANTALTSVDNSYASVYGTNHLANSSMTYSLVGDTTAWSGTNTPNFTQLTDGLTDSRWMIQPKGAVMGDSATNYTQKEEYLQFQFAFKTAYNGLEKFLFSFDATGGSLHYEIFASDSLDTLYSKSLYERSVASDASSMEHIIDFSALELKGIKYFAVRFYNLQLWGDCMLPYEIAVYGGKAAFQANAEPTSDDYATRFGDNWLTTSSYVSTESVDGVTGTPSHGGSAIMVDNLWSTGRCMYQSGNGMNADNNEAGQTDTYFQTTFTLAAPINDPETALIAWGNANSGDKESYESLHYEIFASDNESDLYTKSVYEHNVTSKVGWEHVIDISDKALKGVKYFGIRIYNRDAGLWNSIMVVTEIGLYGGKSILTDRATYSDDENNAYNYGANRLFDSTVTTGGMVNGAPAEYSSESNKADVSTLTNNVTTNRDQIQISGVWDNSYNFSKANENTYIEVTFELKKVVNNPSKFLIAHDQASFESNPTVNQWYEIYASEREEDLYSKSIFVYKNASAKMVEQQLDLTGMDLGTVKYFGIRFYHLPTGCFALPSEIGLYGGEVVKTASITTGHQNYSVGTVYTTYGQNHLEYAIGEAISTDGTTTAASGVALGSVNGILDDTATIAAGDSTILTADNNGLDQTAAYLQLQYTLNAPVDNPEKFVFIHHTTVNGSYNSAHYAVFASDSLDTLYDKALYEFKADAGVGNTHVIDISEFELQNVKYAAIRLYHRAYNNCNQHIEEFGLYGGTMEAGFDTNSTAAFPNTSWGSNNILAGKEVSAVADNGGSIVPFEDTDSYLAGFTDDKTADDGTGAKYIPGLEQGGSFKVTYDLGGTLDNPTTVNFQAGWGVQKPYTVYASATLEDLYNAENAIVEVAGYTGGIVYRNITTDITEKNLTGIKYIGLKVDATNNTMMHITEFAVKGGTYTEDPKEPEVSISLGASVFASTAGQNANDITYRLNVTSDSTIVDMGIISGFKVNIDADAGFQHSAEPTSEEYAEYLKTAPATAVKVSATAEQLTNENLYFHVTNSGTAGTADYSGYKLVTIAYVTVEFEGEEYTYYSNVITKSSMMISRNQARNFYNLGGEYKEIADTDYAGYDFTIASTDINKVREYVEAINALKAQ